MQERVRVREVVRFGVFEVDAEARELRKSGLRIRLSEQPFKILTMLLAEPGEVVLREEIRWQLWSGETFVDYIALQGPGPGLLPEPWRVVITSREEVQEWTSRLRC